MIRKRPRKSPARVNVTHRRGATKQEATSMCVRVFFSHDYPWAEGKTAHNLWKLSYLCHSWSKNVKHGFRCCCQFLSWEEVGGQTENAVKSRRLLFVVWSIYFLHVLGFHHECNPSVSVDHQSSVPENGEVWNIINVKFEYKNRRHDLKMSRTRFRPEDKFWFWRYSRKYPNSFWL